MRTAIWNITDTMAVNVEVLSMGKTHARIRTTSGDKIMPVTELRTEGTRTRRRPGTAPLRTTGTYT